MDSNTNTTTTVRYQTSSYRTYTTISSAPPKRRAGRTKFRETRHPVFKGVRQRGGGSGGPARWVCEVREPNKKSRLWLGTFPTAEMAARAHDVAAMALRGLNACLNFADSAWRLPLPESSDRKEIQRTAAVAAEMFRPTAERMEVVASAADCDGEEEEKFELVMSSTDSEVGPISMFDLMMKEFGENYYYWDAIEEAAGMIESSVTSYNYWDVDYVKSTSNYTSIADDDISLWSYSI